MQFYVGFAEQKHECAGGFLASYADFHAEVFQKTVEILMSEPITS